MHRFARVVVPAAAGSSPVAHPFRPGNADNCRAGVLVRVLRGVQIAVACTRRVAEPNPGGGRPPGPDVGMDPPSRTACTGLLAPDTRPMRPLRSCFNRATPLRSVAGCRCALPPKQAQACGASRSSLLVPRRRELPSAMTPAYRSSGRLAPHRARAAARIRPTGQRARARWNRWRALLSTTSSCLDLRSWSSSNPGVSAVLAWVSQRAGCDHRGRIGERYPQGDPPESGFRPSTSRRLAAQADSSGGPARAGPPNYCKIQVRLTFRDGHPTPAHGMHGIFINYRREESNSQAERIRERISARLGQDRVFMDVAIPPGEQWEARIEATVGAAEVVLVVIGPRWLTIKDARGRRRLTEPDDWVRGEIEIALDRGVRLMPVLVDGASLPRARALPPSMRALSTYQAIELRSG